MSIVSDTVERDAERKLDELVQRDVDSTDSNVRYLAYTQRLRTALAASSRFTRYAAYTSDVGEAFRPVVHPNLVRAAYGVSWLYLAGDVGYETYKAQQQGPSAHDLTLGLNESTRLSLVFAKRSIFQAVASMALPAFTIHSAVRYSANAFAKVKSPRVRAWGPTVTGLAIVPFLPFLFDKPVEHVVDWTFEKIESGLAKGVNGGEPRREL